MGILGMIVVIIGYFIIGLVMTAILSVLSAGVDFGTVGINFKKRGLFYDLYSNV